MTDKALYARLLVFLALVLIGSSVLACGRGSGDASGSAEPTRDLLAATPLSDHVFKQPTSIITLPAVRETTTPLSEGAPDLARGESLYNSRRCAECHGVQGEGVAGKAEALAGLQLTEEEFTDVLRTGGRGSLGNEHLFGTQAISPAGMKALYAYIKSLPTP